MSRYRLREHQRTPAQLCLGEGDDIRYVQSFIRSTDCYTDFWSRLQDTLSASTTLLSHLSSALSQFASRELNVRDNMKAAGTREEGLDDILRQRKVVGTKAEAAEKKLHKMSPEVSDYPFSLSRSFAYITATSIRALRASVPSFYLLLSFHIHK